VGELLKDSSIHISAFCSADTEAPQKRPYAPHSQVACTLDMTIYGPRERFDFIGGLFQEWEVYLQDPRACDIPASDMKVGEAQIDVKYWNPHRLSSIDFKSCPFVSQIILMSSGPLQYQEVEETPDYLEIISGQDDLEETAKPTVVRADLHK
jgi:hypothetical protein